MINIVIQCNNPGSEVMNKSAMTKRIRRFANMLNDKHRINLSELANRKSFLKRIIRQKWPS